MIVNIPHNGETGNVRVGVNGTYIEIPRGVDYEVDDKYAEVVLRNLKAREIPVVTEEEIKQKERERIGAASSEEAKGFAITVTQDSTTNTLTSDKTFAEILGAISAGKTVYAVLGGMVFNLQNVWAEYIFFWNINREGEKIRVTEMVIFANNSVSCNAKIVNPLIDKNLSTESENPVQNKTIAAQLKNLQNIKTLWSGLYVGASTVTADGVESSRGKLTFNISEDALYNNGKNLLLLIHRYKPTDTSVADPAILCFSLETSGVLGYAALQSNGYVKQYLLNSVVSFTTGSEFEGTARLHKEPSSGALTFELDLSDTNTVVTAISAIISR